MESKLYSWSKNGMKMIINSDFKTFNNQTICISRGNVISNTEYGNYIRAYNETECNGNKFEKGNLRDYDLKFFRKNNEVFEYVKKITENKGCMLYQFCIRKNGDKKVFGYIVEQNGLYMIFNLGNSRQYRKYESALQLCKDIIREKENR